MGTIYKGNTLISNAVRTVNNVHDDLLSCCFPWSSFKISNTLATVQTNITNSLEKQTLPVSKVILTDNTTLDTKLSSLDTCISSVTDTQKKIDNNVTTLTHCYSNLYENLNNLKSTYNDNFICICEKLDTVSSDYNALQSCVGLNCTGTVKSVNGINPNTSGEVCIDEVCYANYANCTNYAYALYFASNSTGDRTTCARFCMKYADVEKCPILALCSSGGSDYYISPATNYIKDITITDRKVSFTKGDDTQCCFEFGNVTGVQASGSFEDFEAFKTWLNTSPGRGHLQGSFTTTKNSTCYGFIWVPHRTGIGSDNWCYGMLQYWCLTGSDTTIYHCKLSGGIWYKGLDFKVC